MVVFGAADLRRLMKSYAWYYNRVRAHLSLNKNALHFRPRQTVGNLVSIPILGELHHLYSEFSVTTLVIVGHFEGD